RAQIALHAGARGNTSGTQKFRPTITVLMVGAGLLLLGVFLNVPPLLVARALTRQHEMSVRAALGATRWRLLRQLLVEGTLLAAMGGVASVVTTRWIPDGLLIVAGDERGPLAIDLGADARVFGFLGLLAAVGAFVL